MNLMKHSAEPEKNFNEIHEQNIRIKEDLTTNKTPMEPTH